MRRQLPPALRALLVLTVLLGLAYPLAVTGVSQLAFAGPANGSLVRRGGEPVGSALLGQAFTGQAYFAPRPSAAGEDGYDPSASGGTNLGPTNPELLDAVAERVEAYREANDLPPGLAVPVDAVTASASGLDPHISVANARLQAGRVAAARDLDRATVEGLIAEHTRGRALGVLGEPAVNVLLLNLALDESG